MRSNHEYRAEGHALLKKHWTQPVVATLVYVILASIIGGLSWIPFVGWIGTILLIFPILYAYAQNYLLFERDNNQEMIGSLFDGFKCYGRAFSVSFLMYIYIILWSLLLVIPGIIMSFAYSMAFFVAKDHPELSANECIRRSRDMMRGHKGQLFILYLSFIGWWFLCILTFGIGYLWLIPYVMTSMARFYEDVKIEYENTQMRA